MHLMLKPSLKCNFKCDFCSAAFFHQKNQETVTDSLKDAIKKLNPQDIIITGGDPLMLEPQYFYDLLSINDTLTLSLTSNLWNFYQNPDKWVELFKNPRVGVCTSFQYGDRRKIPSGEPYTEELFKTIMKLFKDKVGYTPRFISIISKENESKALDHVYLAKELGTSCKLNGMLPLGKSSEYYPRYKMVEIYLKIIDLGLEEYEDNCYERHQGTCPFDTSNYCSKMNRSLIIKPNGDFRYGYCEDSIPYLSYDHIEDIPLENDIPINDLINPNKCLSCNLYRFCNNCKLHRRFANMDTNYCQNMSKYEYILQDKGFKL